MHMTAGIRNTSLKLTENYLFNFWFYWFSHAYKYSTFNCYVNCLLQNTSKDELELMYTNLKQKGLGGFL